ncbi:hypothetical protein FGB62_291g015 [Gracilaria domingensis]|nr:hypothetical protein FGB62_291g015 [Gracilaria domingensis]
MHRDAPHHAELCQRISSLQRELRESTEAIGPQFQSRCGHFNETADTRAHLLVRAKLAHELEDLAKQYAVVPLLEKALSHRLEILRLNARDTMGIREAVPLTLLHLRRDTQCVAFIGHWLLRDEGLLDPLHRHERSQYGDWLYGEADRFGDVFASTGAQLDDADVSFLIPLCIVKLRLLTRPAVVAERMAEQEALLDKYMDAIQRKNPVLLKALANPDALVRACVQDGSAPHHQAHAEAYLMLFFCGELLVDVPGARARHTPAENNGVSRQHSTGATLGSSAVSVGPAERYDRPVATLHEPECTH